MRNTSYWYLANHLTQICDYPTIEFDENAFLRYNHLVSGVEKKLFETPLSKVLYHGLVNDIVIS